jgi:hypothetical protein
VRPRRVKIPYDLLLIPVISVPIMRVVSIAIISMISIIRVPVKNMDRVSHNNKEREHIPHIPSLKEEELPG